MRDQLATAVRAVVAAARESGREVLLEHEGLSIAVAMGIDVPRHVVVPRGGPTPFLGELPGDRLVVKTLSSTILHKSDVGAVRIVERAHVADVLAEFEEQFGDDDLFGFLVAEFLEHEVAPGCELLVGLRSTDDFGPIVTLGIGGVHAELLARHLPPGRDVAILSPTLASEAQLTSALADVAVVDLATRPQRGRPPRIEPAALNELLSRWLVLAAVAVAEGLTEFEINPLIVREGRVAALDALGRLGAPPPSAEAPRPLAQVEALLRPRSMAIVGVSKRHNPGRIILENVLAQGFAAADVVVLKPDCDEILGCRCVPSLAALEEPVDLLVVSVAAGQAADVTAMAIRERKARSVILIPGGFGEHSDGAGHAQMVRDAVAQGREQPDGGAVINGANCLGVRSVPGCYNTLFIPPHKLSFDGGLPTPLAVLSQSGAFAVAWASRLGNLDPRYLVTMGNQVDLTVADYLEHLADDPEVKVFACYVEGFRPGDGERFVRIASRLSAEGRTVVLYRSGRTEAGARASASHTASIAGDYTVCRALAGTAGVVVADGLDDFADLTRMFCLLAEKRVTGMRLGAMSNAGFECVAMADHAGAFTLPEFSEPTRERVNDVLETARLRAIVGVRNPLDVTPILDDGGFDECARAVLDDMGVDVGLVGCVPLSGAITTLPSSDTHSEDLAAETSIVRRLSALHRSSRKAWVAVVDAGREYDPMAEAMRDEGVPTFRNADRALRLFERVCTWRLAHDS